MLGSALGHLRFVLRASWSLLTKPATERVMRGGQQLIMLDYPVEPRIRYGYGQPPHGPTQELLERSLENIITNCEHFAALADALAAMPLQSDREDVFSWNNVFFTGLDAVSLYGLVHRYRPQTYLEIGSGNSTKITRRAVEDHNLATRIISIDPNPRADINALCDQCIREPFEQWDQALISTLQAGDVLFLDGSHRCFQNSDTTVFFMEVLPALKPGVVVHVHDIFWPCDYPKSFVNRFYCEQYMLAAWLLAKNKPQNIIMPVAFAAEHQAVRPILEPMWQKIHNGQCKKSGGSFWFVTD